MNPIFFLRLALLILLSLPDALLRFLSGGGVIHRAGRTLVAPVQFLWQTWFRNPDHQVLLSLNDRPVELVRGEWRRLAESLSFPDSRVRTLRTEQMGSRFSGIVPGGGLVFQPVRPDPAMPLLVFFHEGGGMFGGPELSRAFCTRLSLMTGAKIFVPAYRLSPENRFPCALEDAHAALSFARENLQAFGVSDIAVGGAALGGNLAARISLDLKREFKPLPVAQLLISPWLDLSDDRLGRSPFADIWPITAADMDAQIRAYAGAGVSLKDPRLSPLQDTVLLGQPRTLIACGGLDLTCDQAEAYALRLKAARVRTVMRRYDNLPHGFGLFAQMVPEAQTTVDDLARHWRRLILSPVAAEPIDQPEDEPMAS